MNVKLIINNNSVTISKEESPDYKIFVNQYLVKFEDVLQIDKFGSTKYKKKFKSVKERRPLYKSDKENIYFTRGLLDIIPKDDIIIEDISKTSVIEPTPTVEEIKASLPMFNLRDDQILAVNKCLKVKRGVIQLPTATGKSAIISSTIKWLIKYNPDIKILVLAPTLSTVKNMVDTLSKSGIKSTTVDKKELYTDTNVVVTLAQTLVTKFKEDENSPLNEVKAVFYDECHHLKCETWNTLNRLLKNVEYSIGFSALSIDKYEIAKTNIQDITYPSALIIGCSGRVMMHLDPQYYIENHIIATPKVFVVNHIVPLPKPFDESNWTNLMKVGLMEETRNGKVSYIASIFNKYKYKTLILVSEKEHAFMIGEYLYKLGNTNFGISFGAGEGYLFNTDGNVIQRDITYSKEDSMSVVDKLASGEIHIVIASSHLDEGVDIKSLDACILACGGRSSRKLIQRVGRILRRSKSGQFAYVIDFSDVGSQILNKHSNQRITLYRENLGLDDNSILRLNIDQVEQTLKGLEGL